MEKKAASKVPQPPAPAPGGEGVTGPGQGPVQPEGRQPILRIVDDKKAPAVEVEAFKKSKDFQLGDEFLKEHFTDDVVAEHLTPLTRKPHELPEDFAARQQKQMLTEIDQRLRDPVRFPADDWIREVLDNNAHIPPRQLAKVIEARLLTLDVEERARAEQSVREMFRGSPQSKVLTEVGELETHDQGEGPYMSYYAEGKEMAPEAKLDQAAFRLFEDKLSDLVDPTLAISFTDEGRYPGVHSLLAEITNEFGENGEPLSYRNIRRALSQRLRAAQTDQEKYVIRETFWAVRGRQYENMKIALEQVQRNVIGSPEGRATLHGNFLNPTAEQMAEILSEIDTSRGGLERLANDYQGFANTDKGREYEREDIRANLDNLVTNPFDLALKWQERMERTVVEPLKPKETPKVTGKRFKEGPQGEEEEGVTPPGERGRAGPGERGVPEPPTAEPEPELLPPAPEPEPGEKPPLETSFNLGAAVTPNRRVDNVMAMGKHDFAHDLAQLPVPAYARIPVLGKVLWTIRHPIKLGWQNAIARSIFEQEHVRFASDVAELTKQAADQTIPVEMQQELIERVLDVGRERRGQQNLGRRAVWWLSDYAKGLTGISQTSEQKLGKEWLEEQLQLPMQQRDPEVQRLYQRFLEEQDRMGARYSRLPEGLTVEEANRTVIAREAGETRHILTDDIKTPDGQRTLREAANERLKGLISQYANGQVTEEQLVTQTNQYLLDDFRAALPANLQEEFTAREVVSNMLSIARRVTGRDGEGNMVEPDMWERYQTEVGESGKTKWEEVQINVLFGKGEFDPARGRVDMGFLSQRLAERLANRELNRGTGTMVAAVGLAKDALSYGGAYGAGWALSGIVFGQGALVRTAGGIAGIAYMSAVKETGIDLSRFGRRGIKGRYLEEIEQHSKEVAKGRAIPPDATIRHEMDQALVDRVRAVEVVDNLQPLVDQEQLTNDEAQQLLVGLAQLDARLRLTDLSGRREVRFRVQNYIEFTQGRENEEYDRLRGTLLAGLAKLRLHPAFAGQQLFTEEGIRYDTPNPPLGLFDKLSALAEAQLRVSSQTDQVRQWLGRELGLNDAAVNDLMQNVFPDIHMAIEEEDSLHGINRTIDRLRRQRGFAAAKDTLLLAPLLPLAYGVPIAEAAEAATEGVGKYVGDWGRVLQGEIPVDIVNGHPAADLTPLQRGVLEARSALESVGQQPTPTTPVTLDGIRVNVAQELRVQQTPDGGNYLVNTNNGHVFDLTEYQARAQDINGDGKPDLAFVHKNTGAVVDARHIFGNQVNIVDGIALPRITTADILVPSGTHSDTTLGVPMHIPNGTEWVQDQQTGKWDLVVSAKPDKVLIDDLDLSKQPPTAQGIDGALTISTTGIPETGGATEVLKGPQAVAEWERMGTKLTAREWYAYDEPGSQGNELRLYTHKEGDAVVLDMSKMQEGYQRGLTPNPINVQEVIRNQEAVFAFSLPGLAKEPLIISDGADGVFDGKLRLDPNDAIHKVTLPDGSQRTLGEVSRMILNQEALAKLQDGNIATELKGNQNVFNLGLEGKRGFIEAGRLVTEGGAKLQAFATITGISEAQAIQGPLGSFEIKIDLTERVTETVQTAEPTFILQPTPRSLADYLDITLVPYATRQNIEKGMREGQEQPPTREGEPTRRVPQPQPLTPGQEIRRRDLLEKEGRGEELSDEEREELELLNAQAAEEEQRRREQQEQEAQPPQEQGPTPLRQRFEAIRGPVVAEGNRFFVKDPAERIDIPDDELSQYELRLPFFLVDQRTTNQAVVPWAWELGAEEGSNNRRFINAETSTKGDSGLLGVTAASSETPEKQARLYGALADVILRMHEQNSRLLSEWLSEQGREPHAAENMTRSSLGIFKYYDLERRQAGRPEDELLLAYDEGGRIDVSATGEVWKRRLQELRGALDQDRLTSYHLRWIEFLSHSVDVAKVIEKVQGETGQPAYQPLTTPATETLETTTPIAPELAEAMVPLAPSSEIVRPLEQISASEADALMQRVSVHGNPFNGEQLTSEILMSEGLQPAYKVNVEGKDILLSSPYHLDEGRVGVVGYIEMNGRLVPRTFYRSNSQGVWRYLPQYSTTADGKIDWYSKGFGEESIMLPITVQRVLAEMTQPHQTIKILTRPHFVFAGTARDVNFQGTYGLEVQPTPQELNGMFYINRGKIAPEDVRFRNPNQAPNFTQRLATWEQQTEAYGPITIDVFSSNDNSLTYMFCRDSKGRAWVGGIEDHSEMQSVGLRKTWIKGGDLTTPAYEYTSEAHGYGNSKMRYGQHYIDMFQNYLSKIPVVQEYLTNVNEQSW